jgi:hypothetical protein
VAQGGRDRTVGRWRVGVRVLVSGSWPGVAEPHLDADAQARRLGSGVRRGVGAPTDHEEDGTEDERAVWDAATVPLATCQAAATAGVDAAGSRASSRTCWTSSTR